MPFAAGLRESLQVLGSQVPSEFTRGDSLEDVLDRHLLTVEQLGEGEIFTSILLLGEDGKRLRYGAAPNLPQAFRDAVNGMEIGPRAGSCGTAAYFGRPVYATDIATDPLWADYRDVGRKCGFASCWSTPIHNSEGSVLGTFAIFHRTAGGPTREEIVAIDMITDHVAHAIEWARLQSLGEPKPGPAHEPPRLKVVGDAQTPEGLARAPGRLIEHLDRLEALADQLDCHADAADSDRMRTGLRSAAADSRRLISTLRHQIVQGEGSGR